jgi:signal transduction histidine kinase
MITAGGNRRLVGRLAVAQALADERALAGARDVVSGLVGQDRKPVVETVRSVVSTAARDVPLRFDAKGVPTSSQPDPLTLGTLVHVGREAVTNAVKHADPLLVEVLMVHADEWRLQVRDHGCGFDLETADGGFGLESMQRHVDALGGSLRISSTSGATGTTVEAVLP